MSTCLPLRPISPFPARGTKIHAPRFQTPISRSTVFSGLPKSTTLVRSPLTLVKSGFLDPGHLPDAETSERFIRELFGRAEGIFYTVADAAVSNSEALKGGGVTKQNDDWLSGITSYMESILKVLEGGLSGLHVPYAYGFAIILLTVLVKAATFPLTKKQVESAMAMRSLQPQIKAIQQKYAGDQERIQLETARLYKLAGINPLAGCLPTLATIPVWIGLYRALSNVANEGLLTEGFFWIPSLAGPTTIASRQNGSGISWLFPFVDGNPRLGWSDTLAYLVLPVLLILSQYISIQIMQSSQPTDPNMKSSQIITNFLPLMIGYFALSVPSGLSLYWLTNNILSTAQQVWLQKMGGAKSPMGQITSNAIKLEKPQTKVSSVSSVETKTVVKEETKEETSSSSGPRPGERFEQLKKEEARRKQQREEKRRAEEAAEKSTSSTKEEDKIQNNLAKGGNGGVVETVDSNESHVVSKENSASVSPRESENRTTLMENDNDQHTNVNSGEVKKDQFVEDEPEKEAAEVHNGNMTSTRKSSDGKDE